MEEIKTQQKKLPKLTKKQRGFVKDYIKTENGIQSALNNYDIESKNPINVANAIAVENLQKPIIKEAIEIHRETLKSALEKEGITPIKIAKKVNELLEAEKKVFKNNNKTGEIEEVSSEPDYKARNDGLKHATNIYGVEDITKPKGNTYNFIFNQEFKEKIKPLEEAYKEQFKNVKPNQENL